MSFSFQTGAEPIPGYTLMDRLGSGGFGEVWRCEAPGGIFKAAKVIFGDLRQRDTDAYRFAEQELKALKRVKTVRHPYLLTLDRYDIVEGRLVIVMELADCNLWDRFREHRAAGRPGIPREELLQYMSETAEVLDLMNDKHQLQHLDIKPQNLFLLYNHVKVADFGQVKDLEGLVASVTGGITPVYAAPETFDGFVSRFCDQYSLACVYQELLTGQRPFDGNSMQQLLMQHLQAPPNLLPSPANERSALAKALSKKPDDRFPNVSSMVKAIRDGASVTISVPNRVGSAAVPVGGAPSDMPMYDPYATGGPGDAARGTSLPLPYGSDAGCCVELDCTPYPRGFVDAEAAPERPAPSEQTGPGPIRPAVIIGLGHTGLRIVQRLRRVIEDRFGSMDRVPALRLIGIDTDPEAIELAATAVETGLSPLPKEDLIAARLNRTAHYLKPHNNGRMVTEGWFDSQIFYRMTRNPNTMGLRSLGRLAFCDHYRTIMHKVQLELDGCLDPASITETLARTGLDKRTNRPRVYIVAGLGGGTGGGMFLDLAYAVRARLKRIGYAAPDLTALLLTPADTGDQTPQSTLANTFAALTELNHFSHPETVFAASYEDQHGNIRDREAPFARVFIVPGLEAAAQPVRIPSGGSGVRSVASLRGSGVVDGGSGLNRSGVVRLSGISRGSVAIPTPPPRIDDLIDPLLPAVDFLRLDLLTDLGRAADTTRPQPTHATGNEIHTFGLTRFGWPRREVVARTARIMAPVLFGNWVAPDPKQIRTVIPQWAEQIWHRFGLGSEQLAKTLCDGADAAAGFGIDEWIGYICDPLQPKGWRARGPEPEQVSAALGQFVQTLGIPRENPSRANTAVEEALTASADEILTAANDELAGLLPALMDTPDFRFAGTEEAVRHLLNGVTAAHVSIQKRLAAAETSASAAYERVNFFIRPQRGMKKASPAEVVDSLREYPTSRYRALVDQRMVAIYHHLQEFLQVRLADVHACRVRAQESLQQLVTESESIAPPGGVTDLLPVGCASIEEAAQRFLKVMTDDDLVELEHRVQHDILQEFGGLFEACMNSAAAAKLLSVLRTATRAYLNDRLGDVDFAGMLKQKFPSKSAFGQAIAKKYAAAEPELVSGSLWARSEVTIFGVPAGEGGAALAEQAKHVMTTGATTIATADEAVFYREYSNVPLAALAQLGPIWSAAYHGAPDTMQTSPHVRLDITQWRQVDG